MRTIGKAMEERGEEVEYLYCSGDPGSLDGVPGTMAVIQGGRPGKTIGFRADIDALPILEESGLPYSSENPPTGMPLST